MESASHGHSYRDGRRLFVQDRMRKNQTPRSDHSKAQSGIAWAPGKGSCMNRRERLFLRNHRTATGHDAINEPGAMAFYRNGCRTTYRPDFYCQECQCYFEVVGSRQAFHQNREKIFAFCQAYLFVSLKYVLPDGSDYDPKRRHRSTYTGQFNPNQRPSLDYRHDAMQKLTALIHQQSISLAALARDSGIGVATIWQLIRNNRLPQAKTAKLIHLYLGSRAKAKNRQRRAV